MGLAQLVHIVSPETWAALFEELGANQQGIGGRAVSTSPGSELGEDRHELDGLLGEAVGSLLPGSGVVAGEQTVAHEPCACGSRVRYGPLLDGSVDQVRDTRGVNDAHDIERDVVGV